MGGLDWTLYCCLAHRRPCLAVEWWADQPCSKGHGKPWWPADNLPERTALRIAGPLDPFVTKRLPHWVREAFAASWLAADQRAKWRRTELLTRA